MIDNKNLALFRHTLEYENVLFSPQTAQSWNIPMSIELVLFSCFISKYPTAEKNYFDGLTRTFSTVSVLV